MQIGNVNIAFRKRGKRPIKFMCIFGFCVEIFLTHFSFITPNRLIIAYCIIFLFVSFTKINLLIQKQNQLNQT